MYCRACGASIPPGARNCPNCGILISENPSNIYYPTSSSAQYGASTPPSPTIYGSNPYEASLRNPYALTPPPPPPPRRRRPVLLVALACLIIILAGGGIFAFLSHSGSATPTASTLTPAQVNATATAAIIAGNPNPYPNPGGGTLTMYDSLTTYNPAYGWDHVPGVNGVNCLFSGGAYHVIESQVNSVADDFFACNPEGPDGKGFSFTNFALEVQMKILKGDAGGILFHISGGSNGPFYYFKITTKGTYQLQAWANNASNPKILSNGTLQNFNPLNNNKLAVVADGTSIALYVNLQSVGSTVTDTTSSSGNIGLTSSANTQPADVVFSNLRLWVFQ